MLWIGAAESRRKLSPSAYVPLSFPVSRANPIIPVVSMTKVDWFPLLVVLFSFDLYLVVLFASVFSFGVSIFSFECGEGWLVLGFLLRRWNPSLPCLLQPQEEKFFYLFRVCTLPLWKIFWMLLGGPGRSSISLSCLRLGQIFVEVTSCGCFFAMLVGFVFWVLVPYALILQVTPLYIGEICFQSLRVVHSILPMSLHCLSLYRPAIRFKSVWGRVVRLYQYVPILRASVVVLPFE